MARMKQFRNRDLSLWQSAVDEVVAKKKLGARSLDVAAAATTVARPDMSDPMIQDATIFAELLDQGKSVPQPSPAERPVAEAIGDVARFCSDMALKLGRALISGNTQDAGRYRQELTARFGDCDPRYVEAAEKFAQFQLQGGTIPYRRHQNLTDFVIDGKLPGNAKVAIVGDWGTGQPEARNVLKKIADKSPDVVIHLGDIYYSGTDFEVENYFLAPWNQILGLPESNITTYTLSGNHDMFAGGQPYYNLIDKLGQPASYFCLRNHDWQFLAIDTGLHDRNPVGGQTTFLEDTEVAWLQDKINNAGNRKSVLLSHHQLFSAFEAIGGASVNQRLLNQLSPILSQLAIWFWGHEHNLVIYQPHLGVLARCIGHGAFPIGRDELPSQAKFDDVPIQDKRLHTSAAFYNHGYVLMELNGPTAEISYFEIDQTTLSESLLYREPLPAAPGDRS